MNAEFKTKSLVDRVEQLAERAWSQGGPENLRITLDALMFLSQLREAEDTKPRTEKRKTTS